MSHRNRPQCYFQHANLLFASGVPSAYNMEDVHVVCFVIKKGCFDYSFVIHNLAGPCAKINK